MGIELVRHYEVEGRLKEVLEGSAGQSVRLAIRIGGHLTASNVVIRVGGVGAPLVWRAGPQGGKIRMDTWNLLGHISKALGQNGFADDVQKTCEHAVNVLRRGWLVLTIHNGRIIVAKHTSRL